jgi:uncharacterized protein (TIGR02646 family)
MIRIRRRALPAGAREGLAGYQRHVNDAPEYPGRVERAKTHFKAHNRADDAVFRHVRGALDGMCRGPRRCMYCEDAPADEVEHFRPKDLYPEQVFVWKNYLYACGPCNGPKNNQFSIIRRSQPRVLDVARKRGDAVTPPPRGRPALINPLAEDPLVFLELDLRDTFEFVPTAPDGTLEFERAEYTLRVLRLNDRDYLIRAREPAYQAFASQLYEYVDRRDHGATPADLARIPRAVRRSHHPTVWMEMKRQYQRIPLIGPLFERAPEALDW